MEGDFEGEQKTAPTTTTTTTEIDTRRSEAITVPDFTFVRTPTGIAMLVNVVLLFLSWVLLAVWQGQVSWHDISGATSFFYWCTLFPFFFLTVVIILTILAIPKKYTQINWSFSLMIFCAIGAFFLLIGASVLASKARKYNCSDWYCGTISGAAAFGFFSLFGLIVEGLLHFREFRASGADWRNVGFVVCC